MKFYGNAQLQQNELIEAVIPLDTVFPTNPVPGQIVFKSRILYICIELNNGIPIWCPLTKEVTSYKHIQNTSSAGWVVNHNLNTTSVSVTVYDTNGYVIIPDEVIIISDTQVQVIFAAPIQGTAIVLTGYFDGQPLPSYSFEYTQTNPSTSWVIAHGLGRYPIVRVFIGNQEVQPATVTFDTINQITITFSSAQVGQVKLI